ncbi:MAG TPA: DNA alkylation repair protein [Candidatus Limnocylindria bacterium]|nr:DNA alkylation repair protein [Candidatus Limnocylindria bacterium]
MSRETPEAVADRLERAMAAVGTPERAIQEKRYLKSDLTFLGVTVWQIRAEVKAVGRARPELDHDRLLALVDALWSRPVFERRMAATVLLALRTDLLTADDLTMVERLLRESHTWALVDGLAVDVVGAVLAADPDRTAAVLDRWSQDDDFWIRRSSLLAWLRPLRRGASLDRFLAYADGMLDEKEFFIRKAIGWVLREVGKRRPEEVSPWLAPRTQRASGVTMREATKYLPAADRERLMLAYREKRPA